MPLSVPTLFNPSHADLGVFVFSDEQPFFHFRVVQANEEVVFGEALWVWLHQATRPERRPHQDAEGNYQVPGG